jgi:hypothetical protein
MWIVYAIFCIVFIVGLVVWMDAEDNRAYYMQTAYQESTKLGRFLMIGSVQMMLILALPIKLTICIIMFVCLKRKIYR